MAVMRNGDIGIGLREPPGEAPGQIPHDDRAVAWQREQVAGLHVLEAGQKPGQRPLVALERIGQHRVAELAVVVPIAVRTDQHVTNLRQDRFEHVTDQHAVTERQQALVAPSHAAALTTGQHQRGDVVRFDQQHPSGNGCVTRQRGIARCRDPVPRASAITGADRPAHAALVKRISTYLKTGEYISWKRVNRPNTFSGCRLRA